MNTASLIIWLVSALTQQSPVIQNLNIEQINTAHWIYNSAIEAGIEPKKFARLVECESKYDKKAVGDKGKANGVMQFHKNTFDDFANKYAGKNNNLQYTNKYDQISLAALMIRDGYIERWHNCAHSDYVGYFFKKINPTQTTPSS